MKEFAEEYKKGEIATVIDARVITRLYEEINDEEVKSLYSVIEELTKLIGQRLRESRIAVCFSNETIRVILKKLGISKNEGKRLEKRDLPNLGRLTSHSDKMATLRLYTNSYIKSKLNLTEFREEGIRNIFGEDDSKFAKVAIVEGRNHPTLLITTDWEFFKRVKEQDLKVKTEHIKKDLVNFESVMEK